MFTFHKFLLEYNSLDKFPHLRNSHLGQVHNRSVQGNGKNMETTAILGVLGFGSFKVLASRV